VTGCSGISIAACVVFDSIDCHAVLLLGVCVPISTHELVHESALIFPQFWSPSQISFIYGLLQVESGLVLEPPDQRLKLAGFLWHFHGGFIFTSARCSMKCSRGYEKCFCPILIVVFRCDFNP
jgi:hypothetical protein